MFLTKYRPKHFGFDYPALSNWFEESPESLTRRPLTNIHETDESFVLTVEVPGLDKDDIEVSVENDELVIGGERTEKVETEGLLRREIRSSKFRRSFTLGDSIDRDGVKAKLDKGILTVTLTKTAEKVGRKVNVD